MERAQSRCEREGSQESDEAPPVIVARGKTGLVVLVVPLDQVNQMQYFEVGCVLEHVFKVRLLENGSPEDERTEGAGSTMCRRRILVCGCSDRSP